MYHDVSRVWCFIYYWFGDRSVHFVEINLFNIQLRVFPDCFWSKAGELYTRMQGRISYLIFYNCTAQTFTSILNDIMGCEK